MSDDERAMREDAALFRAYIADLEDAVVVLWRTLTTEQAATLHDERPDVVGLAASVLTGLGPWRAR